MTTPRGISAFAAQVFVVVIGLAVLELRSPPKFPFERQQPIANFGILVVVGVFV